MYKSLYNKAGMLAEQIRRGNTSKQRKDPAQGFFPRRTLEAVQEDTEQPIDMISRYIASIRDTSESVRGSVQETPQPETSESSVWDYSNIEDFGDRMMSSESSGRSDVQITTTSGGREQTMTGLFQFSEDRLTDYMNNTGASFTVEEFRNDEDLQKDVFAWHIRDIDRLIDENNLVEQGYDRDGLRAVAHLGGRTGMLNWVRSGGRDNPNDKFGTDLSFYYNKFGG